MWLFMSNAFLSVVDKGGDGTTLLVRARRTGEIEQVFPNAVVKEGGGTDYRYRARIKREDVALKLAEEVRQINYGNFKSTVKDRPRHDAYMRVWDVMHRYQKAQRV